MKFCSKIGEIRKGELARVRTITNAKETDVVRDGVAINPRIRNLCRMRDNATY